MKIVALLLIPILILISGCVETGYVVKPGDNITNISVPPTNATIIITPTTTIPTNETTTTTALEEIQCPETCDDNNTCTEDYCSNETDYECVYMEITPCCGNEICEENETCIEDCPPVINVSITNIHYETPEWIEIKNNGDPVNITDWTLEDLAQHIYTFPEIVLQPNASLKLHTKEGVNNATELYWGYTISIWNNDGDTAILGDAEGNVIDEYTYPIEETTTTTIPETTTTIEETTSTTVPETTTTTTTQETTTTIPGNETTTTTIITTTTSSTTTSTTTSTTSTTTTTIQGIDHILISEVYYDAQGDDDEREWIKLYNPTQNDVDLDGYTLSDNQYTWELPNVIISSLDYLTIARNAAGFYALYSCYPDIDGMTLPLSNTGDKLILKNGEQEIDFVAWENYVEGWDIAAGTDNSIIRISSIDTDTAADWLSEQEPTPTCA